MEVPQPLAHTCSMTDKRFISTAQLNIASLDAMFTEYGRAIQVRSRHRDAGPHMYRAYGLANFAHEVLVQAQPALKA